MRIAAFTDVHNRFNHVAEILRRIDPVDVAIIGGDITTNGTPKDVERALNLWQPLVPRLLAVAGNVDSPAIDALLAERNVSLNARRQTVADVAFFGCSASQTSIGTPYEIPETEIAERITRGFREVPANAICVFVPHAPPYRILDRTWSLVHAGSHAVREFVDRHQPALVICGHIHEARGQAKLGKSLVVNCGSAAHGHYALIELTQESVSATLL